jgi:hypothetical protein
MPLRKAVLMRDDTVVRLKAETGRRLRRMGITRITVSKRSRVLKNVLAPFSGPWLETENPVYRCFGPVLVVFGPVLGPPIGPTTTFSTSWNVFDTRVIEAFFAVGTRPLWRGLFKVSTILPKAGGERNESA